jgi:hypothetical protein
MDPSAPRVEVLAEIYRLLQHHYRSEYVYKNTLVSKVFVGRHRAARAVLLQEFHVGRSIADCVLVNGEGVVYEVKSEYDDLSKLNTQLLDYFQAFTICNVVVHPSMIDATAPIARSTGAGVLALNRRGSLSPVVAPTPRQDLLDTSVIVNSLRVGEVESALIDCIGHVPATTNVRRHRTYLELAQSLDPTRFQLAALRQLKNRQTPTTRQLMLVEELAPLRSVLLSIDPNPSEASFIVDWTRQRSS